MNKLSNEVLIEKYGDAMSEQYRLLMELFKRHNNRELSDIEWAEVQNIGRNYAARLFDNFVQPGTSNELIRDEIFEAVKEINNENR